MRRLAALNRLPRRRVVRAYLLCLFEDCVLSGVQYSQAHCSGGDRHSDKGHWLDVEEECGVHQETRAVRRSARIRLFRVCAITPGPLRAKMAVRRRGRQRGREQGNKRTFRIAVHRQSGGEYRAWVYYAFAVLVGDRLRQLRHEQVRRHSPGARGGDDVAISAQGRVVLHARVA